MRRFSQTLVILFAAICALAADSAPQPWAVLTSGVDTNLRGLSVKCEKNKACVVWASGSNGVVLRSIDDGKSWKQLTVPDGRDLDFRDVEAFDANTAYLMSSGDGQKSRIYKTIDGGTNWKLQYSDPRPSFFLDSLACGSPIHCVGVSDPIDSKFPIIATNDGEHWAELPGDGMPAAIPQEGAFAASGTEIAFCQHKIFFITGGPAAREFHSNDSGQSWRVVNTPIISGNASSGIFSVACNSHGDFVVVGGDYKNPESSAKAAACSSDSSEIWQLAQAELGGFRSAVAWMSDKDLIAVGPTGSDTSHDKGLHWNRINTTNLNAVAFAGNRAWAAGPKGTVAVLKK